MAKLLIIQVGPELWKVTDPEGRTLDVVITRDEAEEIVAILEQYSEYAGRLP